MFEVKNVIQAKFKRNRTGVKKMTEETLKSTINHYADRNKLFNSIKKECDGLKADIKTAMSEMKLKDFDTGDYTATVATVTKESFDEELLVTFVKNLGIRGAVKKKEYVDMDVLEKAIYNGKISQERLIEMGKYKNSTSYQTLKIKKSKKEGK